MTIKKCLLIAIFVFIAVSSHVSAQDDCPNYPEKDCGSSQFCKWSNGSCVWDEDKINDISEVVVTACSDKRKKYNTTTKKCEFTKEECEKQPCMVRDNDKQTCKSNGIKLNTNVPFVGDCIAFGNTKSKGTGNTTTVNQVTAFPTLMGALMNIVMTATLIIWFLMIVVGGVLITTEGMNPWGQKKGKAMIVKVGAVLAILGLSGVILKLINPTFFT